jgi:hypothetical protein
LTPEFDRQSLEQAVLVSNSTNIDIGQVEAWSIREGKQAEFMEFSRRIQKGD